MKVFLAKNSTDENKLLGNLGSKLLEIKVLEREEPTKKGSS